MTSILDRKNMAPLSQAVYILDLLLPILSYLFITHSLYLIFIVAPNEAIMGAVQKILYFHVGSAVATYSCLLILFVSSTCYLVFNKKEFIFLKLSSARIAFSFSSIVLITGMIWGHSSWNTWWRWEPRLVSMLVLWLTLLSYLIVEKVKFRSEESRNLTLAVLGIISALQVPLVIFSIKLLDRTEQLHPEVIAKQGLRDYRYVLALIVSNLALIIFSIWLTRIGYRIEKIKDAVKFRVIDSQITTLKNQ